jgi:hypothetical protein
MNYSKFSLFKESKEKDESMEVNITDMINKLLKDDEEDVKSNPVIIFEKNITATPSFETPKLCINNIPLEHNKDLINVIPRTKGSVLGLNLKKNQLGLKFEEVGPFNRAVHSSNHLDISELKISNIQISNSGPLNVKDKLSLESKLKNSNKCINNGSKTCNIINNNDLLTSSNIK